MANNPKARDNLIPFVKGDKRINRLGRPKNFDGMRRLAKLIGNEETISKDDPVERSVIERILRKWSRSSETALQKAFVEIAYGKVPDNIDHSGTIKIKVVYDKPRDNSTPASKA